MGAQRVTAQPYGFCPMEPNNGVSTLAINTPSVGNGTWLGLQFQLDGVARSVNAVRVYISAVSGSLATTDLTCDVYSDNFGQPGTSLGSVQLGSAPSGAGWVQFNFGTSIALSAGLAYWIVLKNANTTVTATYVYGGTLTGLLPMMGGGSMVTGWQKASSTNSGGNWSGFVSTTCGYQIGFADGSWIGLPVQNIAASSDLAYTTNEWGNKFTSPANATLNVSALSFYVKRTASAGNLRFRLYVGGNAAVNTINLTATNQTNTAAQFLTLPFASPVQIPPGTVCRATVGVVSGGDVSDYYVDQGEYTIDTTEASLLMPFGGTLQKTSTTNNGTTWTDTAGAIHAFNMLLTSDGEFASSGGGAGPIWIGD